MNNLNIFNILFLIILFGSSNGIILFYWIPYEYNFTVNYNSELIDDTDTHRYFLMKTFDYPIQNSKLYGELQITDNNCYNNIDPLSIFFIFIL